MEKMEEYGVDCERASELKFNWMQRRDEMDLIDRIRELESWMYECCKSQPRDLLERFWF